MSEIILKVRNLTRTYVENKVSTAVLKGINLDIEAGKITAVTGKSGSGKSTLLHILGTLDKPTSGEIIFKGQDLTTLSNDAKAAFRNKNLGFIPYKVEEKVAIINGESVDTIYMKLHK